MSKLKIPHKKKAMDENTISKPKRSLRSKHKREKSNKTTAVKKDGQRRNAKTAQQKSAQKDISCVIFGKNFRYLKSAYFSKKTKQFRPKLEARILPSVSSSDIFAQNAASLSGTYDVDLHPYHCIQPSVIDQVG